MKRKEKKIFKLIDIQSGYKHENVNISEHYSFLQRRVKGRNPPVIGVRKTFTGDGDGMESSFKYNQEEALNTFTIEMNFSLNIFL